MTATGRWRVGAGVVAVALAVVAFGLASALPAQLRALMGIAAFILTAVACSANPAAIRWRTVAWGVGLQFSLALLILQFSVAGIRPGYVAFSAIGDVVSAFLDFSAVGSQFVFGVLADPSAMEQVFPTGLVLAFTALPVIVVASSVFTVFYHLGVLQVAVALMARVMMPVMRTSGAE